MMTIAETRKENVLKLAERSEHFLEDTAATIRRAEKAMNSFYRLAGYSLRKFEIENDGRRYNEKLSERMEKRELAWTKRVSEYLKEFNADIFFSGLYPSVIERERSEHGGIYQLHLEAWY